MLRYRVLLIDTETIQERPVQVFMNTVTDIQLWADNVLRKASKVAYVVVYRVMETEVAVLRRDDQGAIQGLQSAAKEANQPV